MVLNVRAHIGCVRANGNLSIFGNISVTLHRIGLLFFQNVRLKFLNLNVLILKYWTNSLQHKIMKSKDLQKLVLSKYEAGATLKKIFEDLNGVMSYPTVKRWCEMIWETGAIDLSKPFDCYRTVHTKAVIQKIKRKSKGGKSISCRKLVLEIDMSFSSAYRILRKDLQMKPYKNRYWRMSIKLSGKNSPIGPE